MRRAARVDENHQEIVAAFKRCGWAVLDIHQLPNCCDLFVSKYQETVAVEIKDGSKAPCKRRLTQGEAAFFRQWKGKRAIVQSVADVLNMTEGLHNATNRDQDT
jgi:hypothetical protein